MLISDYKGSTSFIQQLFQYTKIIKDSNVFKNRIEEIVHDPRVKSLDGKMLSNGPGCYQFDKDLLIDWFLFFSNKYGEKIAWDQLNRFLNNDVIEVYNVLWVYGINIEHRINIEDKLELYPINLMLDSNDKYIFTQNESGFTVSFPKPKCCLLTIDKIKKITYEDEPIETYKKWFDNSRKMHEIIILLNLIPGLSAFPAYETSYLPDYVPMGPFGLAGGSFSQSEITILENKTLKTSHVKILEEYIVAFNRLNEKDQIRWSIICSRLGKSKIRQGISDKILDLAISLEMMLLNELPDNEQISLQFRLRGSWLISTTKQDRIDNYNLLKEIYKHRSSVAHSGLLEKGNRDKIRKVIEKFPMYVQLAENIAKELLINGSPDWNEIILGEDS